MNGRSTCRLQRGTAVIWGCFLAFSCLASMTSPAATRLWDGGGANDFWATALNWSNNIAPLSGDDVVFAGALPLLSTNNRTAGFLYGHITFSAAGYTVRGNPIGLTNGITASHGPGATMLELHVTNQAPVTLTTSNRAVLVVGGDFRLNGHPLTVEGGGELYLGGIIGGTGTASRLIKNGTGLLEVRNHNTYAGITDISAGTLALGHFSGLGTVNGLLNDTLVAHGATLMVLPAARFVRENLRLAGTLEFQSGRDSTNEWTGSVRLVSNAVVRVAPGDSAIISGPITGDFGWTYTGGGFLELQGTHTHTRSMTHLGGTLLLNGQLAEAGIELAGGTLTGTGVVETIDVSGFNTKTIAPGIAGPGRILVENTLTLNSRATLQLELNGTNAAINYDQLVAGGSVSLGQAHLQLEIGIVPPANTTFRILDKTNASAINGTFAGLVAGAKLTNNNVALTISYSGGTGNDIVLTSLGFVGPCGLRLEALGPEPNVIHIAWKTPTLGPTPLEYIVYRNGVEVARNDASLYFADGTFLDRYALAGQTYTYQVVATFVDGTSSGPSNPLTVTALPLVPVLGTNTIVSLLVRFSDFPSEPFTPAQLSNSMFVGPVSLRAYFEEVSYGKFSIKGDTFGWFTLPQAGSNYCTTLFQSGFWFSCNVVKLRDHVLAVLPQSVSNKVVLADRVQIFVHGMGTAGLAFTPYVFFSGNSGLGMPEAAHELGHTFNGLQHAGSWECPGYPVGPDLSDLHQGDCGVFRYGDFFDPMGAAMSLHYNAFMKERLGWLPQSNIQWINQDGDYQLHAVETPTNAVQMLKLDLGQEQFYFFEYRTLTGFNSTNTPYLYHLPQDGVQVRLRPSRQPGCDCDTLQLIQRPFAVVINPDKPFVDPYRGLLVEMLQKTNGVATLRVTGSQAILRILQVQRSGAAGEDLTFTFETTPGARYLVQESPVLASRWTTLDAGITATTRLTTTTVSNAISGPRRFFRVGVDPGP